MSAEAIEQMPEPKRTRPNMPEGYLAPEEEQQWLEWADIDRRLAEAPVYWLCTSSKDGDPHATPIWGAWVGGRCYVDGYYEKTRWGRNLAENPRIVVHISSDSFDITVKGVAEIVNVDPDTYARISDSFAAKYGGYKPETSQGMYSVRPHVVMAWDNQKFRTTATRWQFDQG